MKKNRILKALILTGLFLVIYSCNNNIKPISEELEQLTKAQLIISEINKNCDLFDDINSMPLINAKEVYKNLDNNYLIIDIRKAIDYSSGHIKGSINLKLSEIIDYAQVKGFPEYEKVVIVCYTGQSASFGTAVLRMLGYNNVYSMEWGMSSWNPKFNKKWEINISDKLASKLVKKPKIINEKEKLPIIESNKNSGPEILYTRAKKILKDGFGKAGADLKFIKAYSKKIFIISYNTEKEYNSGHLKGSVNYYKGSLIPDKNLQFLPPDIKVVVYSNKGHESAFIAAYLRLIGYDAKTLKYGANSFMKSSMTNDVYSNSITNNYTYETSEYIEVEEEVSEGGC